MRGQRQGVCSTKPPLVPDTTETEGKAGVSNNEQKKHDTIITVDDMQRTLFIKQTGKLPQTSSQGNKYHMILHKIDSNSTLVKPMKNRTRGEIIAARKRSLTRMRLCDLNPKHQILDNKASEKYKKAIRASRMTYQLVPPNNHRCNTAEK